MNFVGRRVAQVRLATRYEMKKCGWEAETPPMVFVLDNGYIFLPAQDYELNEPGQFVVLDTLSGEMVALTEYEKPTG